MDGQMDGRIDDDEWIDGWIKFQMDVFMDGQIDRHLNTPTTIKMLTIEQLLVLGGFDRLLGAEAEEAQG